MTGCCVLFLVSFSQREQHRWKGVDRIRHLEAWNDRYQESGPQGTAHARDPESSGKSTFLASKLHTHLLVLADTPCMPMFAEVNTSYTRCRARPVWWRPQPWQILLLHVKPKRLLRKTRHLWLRWNLPSHQVGPLYCSCLDDSHLFFFLILRTYFGHNFCNLSACLG